MRQHYHEQLDTISGQLIEMSKLVESAMERATRALLNADLALAESVIADDAAIDALAASVEEECISVIALQQPVASELRAIIGALRMCSTLERMGAPLAGLGLWDDGRLRAYLLFSRQENGYVLLDGGSCAEDAERERADMARLLRALEGAMPEAIFRLINAPPGDALGEALAALGCPVALTQREMIRSLP